MYKVVERCFWIDETKDAETIKEFKEKDKSRASIPLSEKGIGDPKEEDIMTNVVNYKVGQYLDAQDSRGYNLISHVLKEESYKQGHNKTYEFIFCKK